MHSFFFFVIFQPNPVASVCNLRGNVSKRRLFGVASYLLNSIFSTPKANDFDLASQGRFTAVDYNGDANGTAF